MPSPLAEWCQTHSLLEFLELVHENKNKKGSEHMNDQMVETAVQPTLPLEDKPEGEVLVQTEAEVGKEVLAQDPPHAS